MTELLNPPKRFDPEELAQFDPAKPPESKSSNVKSQFFHEKQIEATIFVTGLGLGVLGFLSAAPDILKDIYFLLVNNPGVQQMAFRAGEILHKVVR